MKQALLVLVILILTIHSSIHSLFHPASTSEFQVVPMAITTTAPFPSRNLSHITSNTLPRSTLPEPWQQHSTSPFRVRSLRGRSTDFGKEAFFLRYELEEEQSPGTFVGDVALDCQGEQQDHPSTLSETDSQVGNTLRDESNFGFLSDEPTSKLLRSQLTVSQRSADGTNSGQATAAARYRFVSDSITLFHLDPQTGVMTTRKVIDRDSPDFCRQKPTCEVHVSVVVQSGRHLRIVKVIVDIIDVNDNPPR